MIDQRLEPGDLFVRYSKYSPNKPMFGIVEEVHTRHNIRKYGISLPDKLIHVQSNTSAMVNNIYSSMEDGDTYELYKVEELVGWEISVEELKEAVKCRGKMVSVEEMHEKYKHILTPEEEERKKYFFNYMKKKLQ